ncbi:DUF4329 domain-containing protein [Cochlodiniinecator piscidefendens]|uniref:DUF4329 domain-containing protein n=1 Tax=Cochlodiniinecator piscidefendens TaxID=2715756 RepID=UPI00140AFF7E|nr:DUF4329 domain-containing protein [Cochlodiniinecator piscidefendens]
MRSNFIKTIIILCSAVAVGSATAASAQQRISQRLGQGYEVFAEQHAFAADIFIDLNVQSIQANREFCGFIYYDLDGNLRASPPQKGTTDSCTHDYPNDASRIFASYHTHAAFDPNYLNEYPSTIDMEGDFASDNNGYIATPGGRLWFVDYRKRIARQLCGYHCLPADRRYREAPSDRPMQSVTLPQLREVFGQ